MKSEEFILKLHLTQREIDALFLISGKIKGSPNSLRKSTGELRCILKSHVSEKIMKNYRNNNNYYCEGEIALLK
jgi:hypothetical protein